MDINFDEILYKIEETIKNSNYYKLGFTNATYQDLVKLCNFYGFTVKYAYNLCDENITIYLESEKGLINKIYIFININDYNYTVGNMLSYFGFRTNIKQNFAIDDDFLQLLERNVVSVNVMINKIEDMKQNLKHLNCIYLENK